MTQTTSVALIQRNLRAGSTRLALLALGAALVLLPLEGRSNDFCPAIYKAGVLPLNFNAAFTHIDSFNHANGNRYDGLVVTSFHNAIKTADGSSTVGYFERDLVARITGIGYRNPAWFNKDRDVQVLSDTELASPALVFRAPTVTGT